MMQKYKFVSGEFNPDTQITTVTIATPLGEFSGTAKLHEGDKKSFLGYEIAEIHAYMKFLKAKRARLNLQKNTVKDITEHLFNLNYVEFDQGMYLHQQIRNYEYGVYVIDSELAMCNRAIENAVAAYKEGTAAIEKHMNKDNNVEF